MLLMADVVVPHPAVVLLVAPSGGSHLGPSRLGTSLGHKSLGAAPGLKAGRKVPSGFQQLPETFRKFPEGYGKFPDASEKFPKALVNEC